MDAKSRSFTRALAVALVLLIGRATAAHSQEHLDLWQQSNLQSLITGPVRLNLAYKDQTGSDQLKQVDQLSAAELDGMPPSLIAAKGSPILRTGYFDQLWQSIKGSVCNDVQQNITRLVNQVGQGNGNSVYDMQACVMSAKSYMMANFETNWENDQFQRVSGRRILMNLSVPFNGVLFWVTSPHTCNRHGPCNPGQPQDPAFMVAFTANIFILCAPYPTATVQTFAPPIACQPNSSIDIDGVYGGDVTGQLKQAAEHFATSTLVEAASVGVTGGASLPEAAAGFVVNGLKVLIDGIGTGIALLDDQHLRDRVSAAISRFVGSGTLNANAQTVGNEFNQFFTNVYNAYLSGFRGFGVGVWAVKNKPPFMLDFGLVYLPPAQPQLKNATAAQNKGSIIAPSIAIQQPEVLAGQLLPVKASSFLGTYSTSIPLSWNKTVIGTAHSTIAYGPPPTVVKTTATTFDVTGLKPLTEYLFSVKECDGLTCAPASEEVKVKTEAGGANEVIFWLDKDIKNPVGKFPAPTTGGDFTANVRIPPATAPGQHILYASIYGRPPASAQITVCQAGGCAATFGVVNTANGTMFPPNSVVISAGQVTVRGAGFAANGEVGIYVDNIKTSRLAQAPVGPVGGFQTSFRMPMLQAGQHKLIAIEPKPGTAPPHLQFIEASFPVYVQAAAQ